MVPPDERGMERCKGCYVNGSSIQEERGNYYCFTGLLRHKGGSALVGWTWHRLRWQLFRSGGSPRDVRWGSVGAKQHVKMTVKYCWPVLYTQLTTCAGRKMVVKNLLERKGGKTERFVSQSDFSPAEHIIRGFSSLNNEIKCMCQLAWHWFPKRIEHLYLVLYISKSLLMFW